MEQPKKPGRKKGKGRFAYRSRPTPEQIRKTKDARLPDCPERHGPLTQFKDHEQFVADIPPIQPEITRYATHGGYCVHCRRRIRSRHPGRISQATGAAGVVLGPRVKALVADGHERLGFSYGKLEDWLSEVFGIRFTHGGQSQFNRRLARHARAVTRMLRDALALRTARETLRPRAFARRVAALERRPDRLIAARRQFSDADNRRFAKRLRRQRPHRLRLQNPALKPNPTPACG